MLLPTGHWFVVSSASRSVCLVASSATVRQPTFWAILVLLPSSPPSYRNCTVDCENKKCGGFNPAAALGSKCPTRPHCSDLCLVSHFDPRAAGGL